MRYIYSVTGLILIALGIAALTFLKGSPSSTELARVDERVITAAEFRSAYKESRALSAVPLDKRRFLDNQITKEVLIQEARRRGLDLKEPFRRSIQNYYEQTLLRNLTQEKMLELKVPVSEDEISSYYRNMGRVYELSVVRFSTEREANDAVRHFPSGKAERKILHAEDLPPSLLDGIMSLRAGEVLGRPFPGDGGFSVIKLEGYKVESVPPFAKAHDDIRNILEEKKRGAEMERWLEELKKKSRIRINETALENEG